MSQDDVPQISVRNIVHLRLTIEHLVVFCCSSEVQHAIYHSSRQTPENGELPLALNQKGQSSRSSIHHRVHRIHHPPPGPPHPSSTTGSTASIIHHRVHRIHHPPPGPPHPSSTTGSTASIIHLTLRPLSSTSLFTAPDRSNTASTFSQHIALPADHCSILQPTSRYTNDS